jgi:septum site-determining protein MinD
MDDNVVVATNTGNHLVQNKQSKAGQAFKRVAMRLNGQPELPIEVPAAKKGFWKKIGSKFGRS